MSPIKEVILVEGKNDTKKVKKISFWATKSVWEFTSIISALFPST